jgi:predicted MFS family arabinose efflux permease
VERPRPTLRVLLAELRVGIHALWRHRLLRALALIAAVINLVTYGVLAVLVVFARIDLHMSKAGYGLLLAAAGVGGVVASRVGPSVVHRLGNGRALLLAVALQSAGFLVAYTTTVPALVGAMLALCSAGVVQWNIIAVVLRQTLVANELLGRVNSVYRFIAWGTLPLGSLAGGFLAGAFGVRSVFLAGGIVLAVLLAYLLWLVLRRDITAQAPGRPGPGRPATSPERVEA